MSDKTARTDKCELRIDEQGVVHWSYQPRVELKLADAQREVEVATELTGGKSHLHLVDLRTIKSVEGKARATYAGDEMAKIAIAMALLVGSPVSRVLGNFYIGLNRPSCPTKLFTDEAAALEWLLSQREASGAT